MLSFLKKKTDSDAVQAPAWHPNFRNYERLPDIKVVRTAFFVNGAPAFVAIVLAVYLGMREYELFSLNGQLVATQMQIDADRPASTQAVQQYRKFQEQEVRVKEVDAFLVSKALPSSLLQRFADTRPEDIALDQVDIRENGITLRGSIRGDTQEAYAQASSYIEILRNDAVLQESIEDVNAVSANPNPTTGRVSFEIFVRFKAPAAKK
jgi:hypothetical protein